MTQDLFRQDAYLRECDAHITAITDIGGIVLDRTVFYPLGGGQAGDSGVLVLADGSSLAIADTRKGKDADGNATSAKANAPKWTARCGPVLRRSRVRIRAVPASDQFALYVPSKTSL